MAEPSELLSVEGERGGRRVSPQLVDHAIASAPRLDGALFSLDSSQPLELDLDDALRQHMLRVEYQPQFELSSGRGCGLEALSRWTRATGESVPPSVFIPLAERAGLIHNLGAWVLQTACAAAADCCTRGPQPTTLSVNVSALQIDERFTQFIALALKQSHLPANLLELEITESALIANPSMAIEQLHEWRRLGVRIALDDFGVGYSSLSYLTRLPVDRLKLDRSLIHRMALDRKGAAVMRSIVSLGAELDMEVIAEGVETEVQLQMLAELRCPQVQGYLLGRPMAVAQAQAVLNKPWGHRPRRPAARVSTGTKHSQTHAF